MEDINKQQEAQQTKVTPEKTITTTTITYLKAADLTLKKTILLTKDYIWECVKKFYVYILVLIAFWYAADYYLVQQPTTYTASVSFMTSNDKGGGVSQIMQIAGQFGIGGGGGELKLEKLASLLKSQRMVYKTLMKSRTIHTSDTSKLKKDLLANHYIELFHLRDRWADDPNLKDFAFKDKNPSKFNFLENRVMKGIYSNIIRQFLTTSVGKNGIVRVNCLSTSEYFSKVFVEELAKTLKYYYVYKAVEQQQRTYNLIKSRKDSIETALYDAEFELANWIDQYRVALRAGSLSAQKLMDQERMKRKAEILNVMYSQIVQNLEIAQMNLLSSTPLVQIIDTPRYPLAKNEADATFIKAVGLFLGFCLATLFIVFNKLIRDALQS